MRTFASLATLDGLAHAVSTRAGGVSRGAFAACNLGRRTADDPAAVAENRRRVAVALGFASLLTPRQVHGTRIAEVRTPQDDPGEADGICTDRPGLLLGVLGADCPGVLLVDERTRALAVLHAGWRGAAGGIVPAAVRLLAQRYGACPEELRAVIGPGISQDAFEVGPEVAEALGATLPEAPSTLARGRADRWQADLSGLLVLQLCAAGVPATAIERSPGCTFLEADTWFSHRRDGDRAGRHALLAGWSA